MKKSLRILALFLALLLCCGCAKVVDPQIPYGLLIKCRDFLAFCVFLADQEKPYYNHIAQRYYYAMLTLASISYQWNKADGEGYKVIKKHEDVWQLMPHEAKKVYGEQLKGLRNRCDYFYDEQSRDIDSFKDELKDIVNNEKAFSQIDKKVRTDYEKFFNRDSSRDIIIEECNVLMDEIEILQKDFSMRSSWSN